MSYQVTDVFVLHLYYYRKANLEVVVTMESPIKGRVAVDSDLSSEKHISIIEEVLPAHALSGCDIVACCFGIEKGTIIKVLQAGHSYSYLGRLQSSLQAVIKQAAEFMLACYGHSNCASVSETRFRAWATKPGKGYASMPKLN